MTVAAKATLPRMLEKYRKEAIPALKEEFKYANVMQVPRLQKVVINMGIKEAQSDIKILEQLALELGNITGQKPLVTRAKKSISAFKLREGVPVGLKVTLRGARMWEFLDRLFNIAMPRIRDFQGFSDKGFDGRGNFTLGLQEQTIFPEVVFDKIKKTQGMDISFVTTAATDPEGRGLLQALGLPFKKRDKKG